MSCAVSIIKIYFCSALLFVQVAYSVNNSKVIIINTIGDDSATIICRPFFCPAILLGLIICVCAEKLLIRGDEMDEKKKTVGAHAVEALQKESSSQDPIELEREMHRDYEKNIVEVLEKGKKEYPGNFFIVVITKRERLLENVLRNQYFSRSSCPSPDWDQVVYMYEKAQDRLLFLWVLPCRETCEHLTQYAKKVVPQERQLLNLVLNFNNGSLLRLAKQLNGEEADSPILAK